MNKKGIKMEKLLYKMHSKIVYYVTPTAATTKMQELTTKKGKIQIILAIIFNQSCVVCVACC